MKKLILIPAAIFLFIAGYRTGQKQTPAIDLPEEWQAISKDSRSPDNLSGFFDNDTLYIQFNNAKSTYKTGREPNLNIN